jgi:protein SDA1
MELNLPILQNHIKRDPGSYREEFMRQLRHFEHMSDMLRLDPTSTQPEFSKLVLFLAHVL